MYYTLNYHITNHILSKNIASITTQAAKKMAKVELRDDYLVIFMLSEPVLPDSPYQKKGTMPNHLGGKIVKK